MCHRTGPFLSRLTLQQPSRVLAKLDFVPNSLTSLQVEQNATLIAAGGQDAELHLSYHKPSTSSPRRSRLVWQAETRLTGSINNSVLLTSLNLTGSNESSVEPRVAISNNDGSVRFYDIPMRVHSSSRELQEVGAIKLDVPVNHCEYFPSSFFPALVLVVPFGSLCRLLFLNFTDQTRRYPTQQLQYLQMHRPYFQWVTQIKSISIEYPEARDFRSHP